jgi:hypothetical protein
MLYVLCSDAAAQRKCTELRARLVSARVIICILLLWFVSSVLCCVLCVVCCVSRGGGAMQVH